MKKLLALHMAIGMGIGSALPALAEPAVELSGFVSLVGGQTFNAQPQTDDPTGKCRCYYADYSNDGTYKSTFTLAAESRAGLQAVATLTDKLRATAQLTVHGNVETPQLQWAYLTYALNPDWDVQVGRKRIPLYYYSSFQDVGMAHPWVGLPQELYGWEAVNYNGVSLRNRSTVGSAYVTSSVFAGEERVPNSRFFRSYGQYHVDARWKNIVGADVEAVKDNLTVRVNYLQADTEFIDHDDAVNDYTEKMQAYGIAANLDFNKWFVLTEYATNVRDNTTGTYAGATIVIPQISVGVGMRLGPWTPFLNYSQYREYSSDHAIYTPSGFDHASVSLRYELSPSSAIKAQLDHFRNPDDSDLKAVNIVRISYDRVF